MADIINEIGNHFRMYPTWLVTTCVAIVGVGIAFVLWKIFKAGMFLLVTLLIIALAGLVGWAIFSS